MSVLTDTHNINFEVCDGVLSQSMYNVLSLIQAMLNMSTLSTNDQGKSFWELVYGSVNQVLADHRPAVLYDVVHFRLLCKEYLTLFKKILLVVFCCNFWAFQQKLHDYVCSGCKSMVSQKCVVLLGHPVYIFSYKISNNDLFMTYVMVQYWLKILSLLSWVNSDDGEKNIPFHTLHVFWKLIRIS